MSDPARRPEFVLGSPGDVPDLIPYLMGYTPQESLVIVVLQDQETRGIARVDIADMKPPGAVEDLMNRIWRRFQGADAFLLAYTEDPVAGWELLHRCSTWLPPGAARETMLVNGDTWQLPSGSHGSITESSRIAAKAAQLGLRHLPSLTWKHGSRAPSPAAHSTGS